MPRMNLTDEESKLIFRQREIEDAHRAGWNKGLESGNVRFAKALEILMAYKTGMSMEGNEVDELREALACFQRDLVEMMK